MQSSHPTVSSLMTCFLLPEGIHGARWSLRFCVGLALVATASFCIEIFVPNAACAQTAQPLQNSKASSSKSFLHDRFYFKTNGDGLNTSQGGTIRATNGSILERQAQDKFNLLFGVFTVSTGSKTLTVCAGPLTFDIPPSSSLSFRLREDSAVTIHRVGAPINISGVVEGSSVRSSVSETQTLPGGAIPVQALPLETAKVPTAPLFFIGNAQFSQEASAREASNKQEDCISISSGQVFFSPVRALKIVTPAGVIRTKANSRFFLSLSEGAGVARILNCSAGEISFESGKKFRRISAFEEFGLFDHRPTKEEVLPVDGLGRKEVSMHDVDGVRTASTNAFLLVSMLASPYFLGEWKRDSVVDKKITADLLKSAAAFDSVHPGSEEFYIAPTNFYPSNLDKVIR